jgi:hypothetical protein
VPVPAVGPIRSTWPGASGGSTGSGIGAAGSACAAGEVKRAIATATIAEKEFRQQKYE